MRETPYIRRYQATDKQEIIALFLHNTPHFFAPEEEKDLHEYLEHELEEYFVLEFNGRIIGSGGINFPKQGVAFISWDLLHPDFQRKGFGSILLVHRLEVLKANPEIRKMVVRTSQLVYSFYAKAGFELREVVKNYWAVGFDLYHMEMAVE